MAILSLEEDLHTDDIEKVDGFVDVPPGDYMMEIVDNADVETKSGSGRMLKLRWQVCDEASEYYRQSVFQQINYINPSAEAQRIGRGQLKAILEAVGYSGAISGVDLDEVLVGKPCIVTVGWGKAQGDYPARPEVKKVKAWGQMTPPAQTRAATQPAARPVQMPKPTPAAQAGGRPAAAPAGGNTRPWAARRAG
jgi:hypothetical protein